MPMEDRRLKLRLPQDIGTGSIERVTSTVLTAYVLNQSG